MEHSLIVLAVLARVLTIGLGYLSSLLPLFDASPKLLRLSPWTQPLLRWDAFHFLDIAQDGYVYEHQYAFFPGVPLVMRYLAIGDSPSAMLLAGALTAALICDSTTTFYQLSLHHLGSPSLAYLATVLSLLPSSPATLRFASYAEPFFTYLSYKGMLFCFRSHWKTATVYFMLAGAFRSNGVLNAGFLVWGLVIEPLLSSKKISFNKALYSIILSAVVCAPFAYHQYGAYLVFCREAPKPEWCNRSIPLIYTHVQSKYWNVGFMRYWTVQQLPNFIIATPPLALLITFTIWHLARRSKQSRLNQPFLSPSLTPHAIHALISCCMLLFASHTQIALRWVAAMPITYWAAAWLMLEHPKLGKCWTGWSIIWGSLSVVLWATFLPPA
ncbi:glycosyltransferase family 76 protein [Mycena floridula]|nr:glycosyltransferase family 76 protein [Mycena floridula]